MTENTLPQELREWIETWVSNNYPFTDFLPRELGFHENDLAEHEQNAAIACATALYAHLKPLIDEKDADRKHIIEAMARGTYLYDKWVELELEPKPTTDEQWHEKWLRSLTEIKNLKNLLDAKEEIIKWRSLPYLM